MNNKSIRHNYFRCRLSNEELDTLQARAKSLNMSLSAYLRWRGLQPIGRLKSPEARKALDQSTFILYMKLTRELNRQGINLNQIARTLNWARKEGQSIGNAETQLAEVRKNIQDIATSIQHLGANS